MISVVPEVREVSRVVRAAVKAKAIVFRRETMKRMRPRRHQATYLL